MKRYERDYKGKIIIVNDFSNQMTKRQIDKEFLVQKNRIDQEDTLYSAENRTAFIVNLNGRSTQLAELFGSFLECLPSL
ncbi:MAG: hypothetical protein K5852_05395 [Eubacterium sp.]|nr:hypothetical protein [Eubacterium sp.]